MSATKFEKQMKSMLKKDTGIIQRNKNINTVAPAFDAKISKYLKATLDRAVYGQTMQA